MSLRVGSRILKKKVCVCGGGGGGGPGNCSALKRIAFRRMCLTLFPLYEVWGPPPTPCWTPHPLPPVGPRGRGWGSRDIEELSQFLESLAI